MYVTSMIRNVVSLVCMSWMLAMAGIAHAKSVDPAKEKGRVAAAAVELKKDSQAVAIFARGLC